MKGRSELTSAPKRLVIPTPLVVSIVDIPLRRRLDPYGFPKLLDQLDRGKILAAKVVVRIYRHKLALAVKLALQRGVQSNGPRSERYATALKAVNDVQQGGTHGCILVHASERLALDG